MKNLNIRNKLVKLISAFFLGAAVAFGFLKHKKEDQKERIVSEEKKE